MILTLIPVGVLADTNYNSAKYDATTGSWPSADGNTIAPNEGQQTTLNMAHKVARKSSFYVQQKTSAIREVGDTTIGSFTVRNNTRDGFSIFIQSSEGGVLHPASTEDGEANIPYTLEIIPNGTLGDSVDAIYTFESTDLGGGNTNNATQQPIFQSTSTGQTSPTDLTGSLVLKIDTSLESMLLMAGMYSDTLILTYEDN